MAKTTTRLVLTELEKLYLLNCSKYVALGSVVDAGSEQFVQEQGVLSLLARFPELLELTPRQSDLCGTVGGYLVAVVKKYIRYRMDKVLAAYHSTIRPRPSETRWAYSQKSARRTIVGAMVAFAPQLRELDPSYVPPDMDMETFYDVYLTITCTGEYCLPVCSEGMTKRDLLRWASAYHFTTRQEAERALLAYLVSMRVPSLKSDHPHEFHLYEETLPEFDEMVSQILHAGEESPLPMMTSDEVVEAERTTFAFTIETVGCQSEDCTSSVDVQISREELLAWASGQSRKDLQERGEGLLWHFLLYERGHAFFDDHQHEFEMDLSGEDQYRTMVAIVTTLHS